MARAAEGTTRHTVDLATDTYDQVRAIADKHGLAVTDLTRACAQLLVTDKAFRNLVLDNAIENHSARVTQAADARLNVMGLVRKPSSES